MILPLLTVMGLFIFGYARVGQGNSSETTLRVTLIQPSIPQTLIWNPNEDAKRFQQLIQLTDRVLAENTNQEPPGPVIQIVDPSNLDEAQSNKLLPACGHLFPPRRGKGWATGTSRPIY